MPYRRVEYDQPCWHGITGMKKIFYEKVGRRYVPVSEYDSNLIDSFRKGNHLVMTYPGGQSRMYNIDPDFASMIAAGRYARDAMAVAIRKAAEMHHDQTAYRALEPEQLAAWENFKEVMGERGHYIQYQSVHDIAEAGVNAMQQEAERLMTHPAVKDAYDKFLLVCKLTKENQCQK